MKRYLFAALAAALLMPGTLTLSARAQDDDAPPPPEQAEAHGGGRPDGAKMAERLKKRLGLSDEQAGKLKDAMKARDEALKPLGDKMKETVKKLDGQLKAKAPDADIQASLDALKTARQAMAAEMERFHDALAGFLTPTQRGQMAVDMAKMMRRQGDQRGREPRRRGGPRGGGGRGGDDDDD